MNCQLVNAAVTTTPFSLTLTWTNPVVVSQISVVEQATMTPTEDSPFMLGPNPITQYTIYHLKPSTGYSATVTDGTVTVTFPGTTSGK